jgi:hypothetical protein
MLGPGRAGGSRLEAESESRRRTHVSRAMEYDFGSDRSRSTPGGIGAGSGGGGVDDVTKRLGVLERDMSDLKVQVGSIAAQLPHLATKAEIGDLRAAISEAKTSIVQWVVGTTIAAAGIAFAIAKLVH